MADRRPVSYQVEKLFASGHQLKNEAEKILYHLSS